MIGNATVSTEPDLVLTVVAFVSGAMVGAAACATVGSAVASKMAGMAGVAAVGWRQIVRWLVKAAKAVRRILKRRRR